MKLGGERGPSGEGPLSPPKPTPLPPKTFVKVDDDRGGVTIIGCMNVPRLRGDGQRSKHGCRAGTAATVARTVAGGGCSPLRGNGWERDGSVLSGTGAGHREAS